MNELDRKLYSLLGDKTLSFGVLYVSKNNFKYSGKPRLYPWRDEGDNEWCFNPVEMNNEIRNGNIQIIGHEPTIADLHRWMKETLGGFVQEVTQDGKNDYIVPRNGREIKYDSSKSFLSQSEETKLAIVNLIESNGR